MDEFLTVRDIACALKKAVKTVYVYIETERIPPSCVIRFGSSIRMKRSDFDKWVNSLRGD